VQFAFVFLLVAVGFVELIKFLMENAYHLHLLRFYPKYQLFFCKVRTVKGQWGVVYPEYANSYASSNMQYLKLI
ncbi:hypothetical protein, partial [Francisella tularensis]|uniref:hypothetical protein n=1 Tax=Francisella tularensis TaxID=263 RepID=UPI00197AD616